MWRTEWQNNNIERLSNLVFLVCTVSLGSSLHSVEFMAWVFRLDHESTEDSASVFKRTAIVVD